MVSYTTYCVVTTCFHIVLHMQKFIPLVYICMCLDVPLSSTSEKFNVPVHPMTLGEFYEQNIKVKGTHEKGGDEVLEHTDHPLYVFEQVSGTDATK